MIHKTIMFVCLFAVLISNAQNTRPSVKSKCFEYYTDKKNGKLNVTHFTTMDCELYDKRGNVIKKTTFKKDGSYDYSNCYTYEYDANNNKIKKLSYTPEGDIDKITNNTYNTNNQITKHSIFNNKNQLLLETSYSYKYDLNNNILKETCVVKPETPSKISYIDYISYDFYGNILTHTRNTIENKQVHKYEYTYNKNGHMLSEIFFDENNELKHKSTYKLGTSGRILKWEFNENRGKAFTEKSDYDKYGNKILWIKYNAKMELLQKIEYCYNEYSQIIKEKHYNIYEKLMYVISYKENHTNTNAVEYTTFTDKVKTNFIKQIVELY
ncbi:hypothetical protein KO500_15850 [Cellulophaga baltica]|uniref:hypothetical protein n=1 Tax=Cellulophaga TaxID=104264 RepID=UPI001C076A7A|nr:MULTISPECIES: hypothetical protein [Cellulophaga]MBU2997916.1 hypothetical protein [Cellulophaga baltica]MDO6769317.1 hypothetical protein [Cellulophaga sp. 1_MG-2023]